MILYVLIIILVIYLFYYNNVEHAAFLLDGLYLPDDPERYDVIDIRSRYRGILGVKPNLKINKNGQIEKITYTKPKPELGETKCNQVICPSWFSHVHCWKCS